MDGRMTHVICKTATIAMDSVFHVWRACMMVETQWRGRQLSAAGEPGRTRTSESSRAPRAVLQEIVSVCWRRIPSHGGLPFLLCQCHHYWRRVTLL